MSNSHKIRKLHDHRYPEKEANRYNLATRPLTLFDCETISIASSDSLQRASIKWCNVTSSKDWLDSNNLLNMADKIGMSAKTAVVSTAVVPVPELELVSFAAAAAAAAFTTTPPDAAVDEVDRADSEDIFVGAEEPRDAFPEATLDVFELVLGFRPRIQTRCYTTKKRKTLLD